jgi:hypothetical protein
MSELEDLAVVLEGLGVTRSLRELGTRHAEAVATRVSPHPHECKRGLDARASWRGTRIGRTP